MTTAISLNIKSSHTFISLAVGACLVCYKLHKALECLLVLRSLIYGTSRHYDGFRRKSLDSCNGSIKIAADSDLVTPLLTCQGIELILRGNTNLILRTDNKFSKKSHPNCRYLQIEFVHYKMDQAAIYYILPNSD